MIHRSDMKIDNKFGDLLVEHRLISKEALERAFSRSKISGNPLVEVLTTEFELDETQLYTLLSESITLPFENLENLTPNQEAIRRVPIKIASHYGFMPVDFNQGKLYIAVDYPLNIKMQDEIRLQLGCEFKQLLARRKDILNALKEHYGIGADTVERIVSKSSFEQVKSDAHSGQVEHIDKLAGDASVINLVNEIIYDAFEKRATDIHLEPYRGEFRIRYRIDGLLHDVHLPQKTLQLIMPILSRIKLMANLDIVDKRFPQDGKAVVKVKNKNLDLRVSSIPTQHGESIVIRILPTQMISDLKKLGLGEKNVELLENLIKKPNGIILLTGPTGSGKTTTLYACLHMINSPERKIITIEDPVEYEIPGITQIQVLSKVGFDFARGLRSMLRHDPDVMMVGEIRDFETAEIAIRAALTGHLVFSTLHTNDAISGVARLLDIGLEPFLVASSVEAIIAQRLVRSICNRCKVEDISQPFTLKKKIANDLNLKSPLEIKISIGKGCEECGHTGFRGRTAIHEVFTLSEAIKEMVARKASGRELRQRAIEEGMVTLLQDGWKKVIQGETTPGEVLNVVNIAPDSAPPADTERERIFNIQSPPSNENGARSYARIDASIEVAYSRIEVLYRRFSKQARGSIDETGITTLTENVSAGGFLLKVNELMALGDILELKFKLHKSDSRSIQVLGRVVRLEEATEANAFFAGVMFLDLLSADRNYINEYILRAKQETKNV